MAVSNPAAQAELAELISEARVLAAIASARDLPASAPVVVSALACLENSEYAAADLKRILMADQAVAARILRLANSAYFGFRSEVRTVSQAVVLLGTGRVRTILHRILIDRILDELGASRARDIRKMSLATATAACLLSQLLVREDAEQMLLAGLLHNIGELFLFVRFPSEYERRKGGGTEPGCGMTPSRVGRLLLEAWNFPHLYPAVVEYCDRPLDATCPGEYRTPVWLVHAGRRLAEGHLAGEAPGAALEAVTPPLREGLHLDASLAQEVFAAIPSRMSLEQLQAGRW
jgi:HD-like signal output (HDOD) protein